MSGNVTPIDGSRRQPTKRLRASDIHEVVIRAKQIVCAVRVAEDHEGVGE